MHASISGCSAGPPLANLVPVASPPLARAPGLSIARARPGGDRARRATNFSRRTPPRRIPRPGRGPPAAPPDSKKLLAPSHLIVVVVLASVDSTTPPAAAGLARAGGSPPQRHGGGAHISDSALAGRGGRRHNAPRAPGLDGWRAGAAGATAPLKNASPAGPGAGVKNRSLPRAEAADFGARGCRARRRGSGLGGPRLTGRVGGSGVERCSGVVAEAAGRSPV